MPFRNNFLILFVAGYLLLPRVWAQEVTPGSEAPSVPSSSESAPQAKQQKSKQQKSKRRIPREKEAEGTKAPRSFDQSDTIIKSRYEYKGQPLEVDTD